MPIPLMLPLGIAFGLVTWTLVVARYLHPLLKNWPLNSAIEPILYLHTFRYVGLMFLVPGVTSEVLDPRFAHPAAYGDLVAALLAFVALATIRLESRWALPTVWAFNLWGTADLLNAVGRGILFTDDGQLGATYWIPAIIVPVLLVTHGYIFVLLTRDLKEKRRMSDREVTLP